MSTLTQPVLSTAARWVTIIAAAAAADDGRAVCSRADLLRSLLNVLNNQHAGLNIPQADKEEIMAEIDACEGAFHLTNALKLANTQQQSPRQMFLKNIMKFYAVDALPNLPGPELKPAVSMDTEADTIIRKASQQAGSRPCLTSLDLLLAFLEEDQAQLGPWMLARTEGSLPVLMDNLARFCEGLLVVNNFTYIIVPFAYLETYQDAVKKCAGQSDSPAADIDKPHWQKEVFKTERLFEYIDSLVWPDENYQGSIGSFLRLTSEGRTFYPLPKADQLIYCHLKNNDLYLYLEDVDIFLFETNVGFLSYRFRYHACHGIDDIIAGNYNLKKFIQEKRPLRFQNRPDDNAAGENPEWIYLDMARASIKMVSQFDIVTYFESDAKPALVASKPSFALVYTGVSLDKSFRGYHDFSQRLMKILFELRRAFKETYKPAPIEYDPDSHPELLQLFANSYWGIAHEGLANVIHLVDDEKANIYFKDNYPYGLKQVYYYLYMLVLHQRYALLYLSIQAAKIPPAIEDKPSLDETREQESLLMDLRKKMAFYVLRTAFRQVSNNSHHNRLYEKIRECLGIESLMEEIRWELQAISALEQEVQASYRIHKERADRLQRQEELEAEQKIQRFVLVISTVFLIISTLSSAWQIYSYIQDGVYPSIGTTAFTIALLTVCLISLGTIGGVWYFFRKWRRVRSRTPSQ